MPSMSYWRIGDPTQIALLSCGVYPANQDCRWLSVVPVLPAAGRPFASALPSAVPPGSKVPVSSSVTPWATPLSMTCLHGGGSSFIFVPLAVVIDLIGFGGQYFPS